MQYEVDLKPIWQLASAVNLWEFFEAAFTK